MALLIAAWIVLFPLSARSFQELAEFALALL
jgi:hypothetical protein